jgi:hypothetical protein
MDPQLPRDFTEFLSLLNKHHVSYLLIGGYAVGFHGYVRATNDIDIWIEASSENASRAEAAIREFGFDLPTLSAEKLIEEGKITRMGRPPMRIEMLNSISGVLFHEAYGRKLTFNIGSLEIPMISLPDLLVNKRASGRTKDLADAEELERFR